MPAIELYDGPAYRVLRRYLYKMPDTLPDVLILSAKWGLVSGERLLTSYDRSLTASRARELRPHVTTYLRKVLKSRRYDEIFISMSDSYSKIVAIQDLPAITGAVIHYAQGGRARKLSELYDWLHGTPPPVPKSGRKVKGGKQEKPRLRGIEVQQTKAQALALARSVLQQEIKAATSIHSWYVQLNNERISPKWLVSKLTGLPVSAFITDEARRLLGQLGIEVRRVSSCHASR